MQLAEKLDWKGLNLPETWCTMQSWASDGLSIEPVLIGQTGKQNPFLRLQFICATFKTHFLSYLYETTFLNKCISFRNGRLTSAEPRNSFLHQPSVHMLLKPVKTKQLCITHNKT
jgi:hypothetical protein